MSAFVTLIAGIVLPCDPCELRLSQIERRMHDVMRPELPSKSYNEIAAELTTGGEEVPPMLAMLAREERAEYGEPRFEALRALWRARVIQ